jgi:hypothetical protein
MARETRIEDNGIGNRYECQGDDRGHPQHELSGIFSIFASCREEMPFINNLNKPLNQLNRRAIGFTSFGVAWEAPGFWKIFDKIQLASQIAAGRDFQEKFLSNPGLREVCDIYSVQFL